MIISRTPYRISLFGGGTDYPAWYMRHGGQVLATSIDKYCYLTARHLPPFFDYKYRVVWSKIEMCKTIEEIQHPAVKAVLNHLKITRGLELHCVGDLPARSGMGSSSTFTVGLLNAIHAMEGRMVGKHELALQSINLEQNVLKETVGSQDQVAAAYGGLNHVAFHPNGEIEVTPVTVPRARIDELNSHLMLFYTGIKRTSSNVSQTYVEKIDKKKRQLRIMKDLVTEAISILNSSQDLKAFGELFVEAWDAKKSLSSVVSNSNVDEIHAEAISAGAMGGKLTGAGGGGFLLLFAPPDLHEKIRAKLSKFLYVPFKFDFGGSKIIFAAQDADYSELEEAKNSQLLQTFRELEEVS